MKKTQPIASCTRGKHIQFFQSPSGKPTSQVIEISDIEVFTPQPKKACEKVKHSILPEYLNRGWSYSKQRATFIKDNARFQHSNFLKRAKKELAFMDVLVDVLAKVMPDTTHCRPLQNPSLIPHK